MTSLKDEGNRDLSGNGKLSPESASDLPAIYAPTSSEREFDAIYIISRCLTRSVNKGDYYS